MTWKAQLTSSSLLSRTWPSQTLNKKKNKTNSTIQTIHKLPSSTEKFLRLFIRSSPTDKSPAEDVDDQTINESSSEEDNKDGKNTLSMQQDKPGEGEEDEEEEPRDSSSDRTLSLSPRSDDSVLGPPLSSFDIIPKFYHANQRNCAFNRIPDGNLSPSRFREIESAFRAFPERSMPVMEFSVRCVRGFCGIPEILTRQCVHRMATLFPQHFPSSSIHGLPYAAFASFWTQEMAPFDPVERVFRLIKQREREFIEPLDLLPIVRELVRVHPGLRMLTHTKNFQERYSLTVLVRIFYVVNSSRTGRISLRELRYSSLLTALHFVSNPSVNRDINDETDFFSYQHFYVLLVTFLELDRDADGLLSIEELLRLGDGALTPIAIKRMFHCAQRALSDGERGFAPRREEEKQIKEEKEDGADINTEKAAILPQGMDYSDFVYFYLSYVDKTNRSAVRFWFEVCDWGGDGALSVQDLRYLYRFQCQRMAVSRPAKREGEGEHEEDEKEKERRSSAAYAVEFEDMLTQFADSLSLSLSLCEETEREIEREGLTLQHLCASPALLQSGESGALFDRLLSFDAERSLAWESLSAGERRARQRERGKKSEWARFAQWEYARMEREELEKRKRRSAA